MAKHTVKCPQCRGTGRLSVATTVHGKRQPEVDVVNCPTCEGRGRAFASKASEVVRWLAQSCFCGNRSGICLYYGDQERWDCPKKHWRCKDCGGITQVG